MKKLFSISSLLVLSNFLMFSQRNQLITVKAGTKVADYFPVSVRYRYPDFTPGKLIYRNGNVSDASFNYNLLPGEIEFIQSLDTLTIINKKDINKIVIAQDTFYYDNGYIEQIYGGKTKAGMLQYIKLKDVVRKGAMGSSNRSVAIDTYNSVPLDNNIYGIIPAEDLVFQKTEEFYFLNSSGEFVLFTRRNVLKEFSDKKDAIDLYLKSNKINFNSKEDLVRLARFLGGL